MLYGWRRFGVKKKSGGMFCIRHHSLFYSRAYLLSFSLSLVSLSFID
jgi:hypothetical protein